MVMGEIVVLWMFDDMLYREGCDFIIILVILFDAIENYRQESLKWCTAW